MHERTWSLENGLRIVATQLPHLHSTSISLCIGVGPRDETLKTWGLSHLVEHMVFRGSEHYPSARLLAGAFEAAGGTLEGETWRDHTQFTVAAHPSQLSQSLMALADMIQRPIFEGLGHERSIVLEELLGDLDDAGRPIDLTDLSRETLWANHPMGRAICGSESSVTKLTLADVRAHHSTYYIPSNATLAVAGPFDLAWLQSETRRLWSDWKGDRELTRQATPVLSAAPPLTASLEQPGTQLSVQLTFCALPDTHPDFAAQRLLASVLDDGFTSRLPCALYEKTGLVYELDTGLDCYSDLGAYDIALRASPLKAHAAILETLHCIGELARFGVTAMELNKTQERALFEMDFRVDSPEEIARSTASAHLFQTTWRYQEERRAIRQATQAQLNAVARRIFSVRPPLVTVVGPNARVCAENLAEDIRRWHQQLRLDLKPIASARTLPATPTYAGRRFSSLRSRPSRSKI